MLKQEEWGFTNPVVSDLYGKPPLVWKDMDIHLVVYETDIENIEKVIPEPLEARTNKVFVWQSHFDLGTTQVYGDNVFEKCGINRDRARRGGKRRYFQGKTGLFTRDRTGRGPGFLGYFETGASTRSALFFYALLSLRRG